jgi:hypothetical protein
MLPTVPVKVLRIAEVTPLHGVSAGNVLSLKELASGKVGVIDLWHTKCTRCPAALEKLNQTIADLQQENSSFNDVLFLTLSLSQGSGDVDTVQEIVEE